MADHDAFEPRIVEDLMGRHVLVGLTWIDREDNEIAWRQFQGHIVAVQPQGITVRLLNSDELFTLPPDPAAFQTAPEGVYRLRSTGEQVVNPELVATWVIRPRDADEDASD